MPSTKTLCQLCRRLVRIVSVPMPASFKTECLSPNYPITADCTQPLDQLGEPLQFAYQVSLAEPAQP
jgi:hypothetical protein